MSNTQKSLDKLGKEIVEMLYEKKMIMTWYRDKPEGWKLANGMYSPYYINMRVVPSFPELYYKVQDAMCELVVNAGYRPKERSPQDKLLGLAMAGISLSNAITLGTRIPSLYTRKLSDEIKTKEDLNRHLEAVWSGISSHGQHKLIEGELTDGDRIGIVDDLVTSFTSKELGIRQLQIEAQNRNVKVIVEDIFVLLNREQGADAIAAKLGYTIHSVIPFISKGLEWLKGPLEQNEYNTIIDYVRHPDSFQSELMQQSLVAVAKNRRQ
ncbi:MAG: hypothetical protein KGH61_02460 [Candidatus Micrarchaeota archaeon]|nr:hypothetical protein [Candidatus Micrarchaeota archaeon]MDE1847790.1 hypothetical protein [Candidatus Micrarchaeota archaeon]MDE1864228.1 hypothetical protein [Candidatus Micrarchaeota archaeon]